MSCGRGISTRAHRLQVEMFHPHTTPYGRHLLKRLGIHDLPHHENLHWLLPTVAIFVRAVSSILIWEIPVDCIRLVWKSGEL